MPGETTTGLWPGDYVMVKLVTSSHARKRTKTKLAHEQWTGPSMVTAVVPAGLGFDINLNGRRIRKRIVSAANFKTFHARPNTCATTLRTSLSYSFGGRTMNRRRSGETLGTGSTEDVTRMELSRTGCRKTR